jgi:hypothetical protein
LRKAFLDMNRLVIIGNGFDLAHGLPTTYKDFIDDFWRNFKDKYKTEGYKKLVTTHDSYNNYFLYYSPIENFNDFKSNLTEYCKENSYRFNEVNLVAFAKGESRIVKFFQFNSDFFKTINKKNSQDWVDIENEYYYQLKKIIKSECLDVSKSKEDWSNEQRIQVETLNNEFELVKKLLEEYLNKIDKIQRTNDSILKHFELIKINEEKYLTEFSKQDRRELEDFQNKYISERVKGKEITTYCLNFNYTQTINKYIDASLKEGEYRKYGIINNLHIHGRLNDKNNKINFGFGDEMDDDYKAIENLDDNEYLKNFKSFQYLQNSNYKILLDFIDSDKFQIFIMGHSCGLSDRTLLNTIFEHNNCRSIKVFYHQRKDGNDNYTEIIQNISRHFNKKKLMREKIVNKMLCEPLLKIQLPLK